nr:zinc-ribbon domain protein [uncultured bacterium]
MYCPKCSQQQSDDNVRYCSRCGFPLGGVAELLASGGVLEVYQPGSPRPWLSPRQKGIRQGAMMMLSLLLVMPVVIFLLVAMLNLPGELIPLIGAILFMGGILRILYAVIFEEDRPPARQESLPQYVAPPTPARLSGHARGSALPPAQSTPTSTWRGPVNTSELVTPPSVTENTTRLLDERPDK